MVGTFDIPRTVGDLLERVKEGAFNDDGTMKSETVLHAGMVENDNFLNNTATNGLPAEILKFTNEYFDGNATAATTFFLDHAADFEAFKDKDPVEFLQKGGPAFVEALRQEDALVANAGNGTRNTVETGTPEVAEVLASATTTTGGEAPAENDAEVSSDNNATSSATVASATTVVAGVAAAGAVVAGAETDAATRARDAMKLAMEGSVDANTDGNGVTNFLERLSNMDFDTNGDGKVGLMEFLKPLLELFTGGAMLQGGAQGFDMQGMFGQLFGGAGTQSIGASLAGNAGLDTTNVAALDATTGEPVITPSSTPSVEAGQNINPGADPNDLNNPAVISTPSGPVGPT